jgi:hypothetical protein
LHGERTLLIDREHQFRHDLLPPRAIARLRRNRTDLKGDARLDAQPQVHIDGPHPERNGAHSQGFPQGGQEFGSLPPLHRVGFGLIGPAQRDLNLEPLTRERLQRRRQLLELLRRLTDRCHQH